MTSSTSQDDSQDNAPDTVTDEFVASTVNESTQFQPQDPLSSPLLSTVMDPMEGTSRRRYSMDIQSNSPNNLHISNV